MKKCTEKRRRYNAIVKEKRTRRFLRRKPLHRGFQLTIRDYFQVQAPEIFSLVGDYRLKLLAFIDKLKELALDKKKHIMIDFSKTKKMVTSGTILFTAELRNLHRLTGDQLKFRCHRPKNNKVAQVLKQIGLLRLLKQDMYIVPKDDDVVNWRVAYGKRVVGEKYKNIVDYHDGELTPILDTSLYKGLTEAMTNCHQHAYIAERDVGPVKNDEEAWWMFSQEKDDNLVVVFCDLGVGIPGSLPITNSTWYDQILKVMGYINDGELIRQAIELSRTRTHKRYRGKGLRQLVDVVMHSPGARLMIFSNTGLYEVVDGKESCHNFYGNINGTIIEWVLPLAPRGPI